MILFRKNLGALCLQKNPTPEIYILDEDDSDEDPPIFTDDENPVESNCTLSFEDTILDNLIQAKVNLTQGDKAKCAKVIGRTRDHNGDTVGK